MVIEKEISRFSLYLCLCFRLSVARHAQVIKGVVVPRSRNPFGVHHSSQVLVGNCKFDMAGVEKQSL